MFPVPSFLAPAAVCASLLNRLLRREPWARDRLARHSGKTVRFEAGAWAVALSLSSDGEVQPSASGIVPDVTLTIPESQLRHLPGVLRSSDPDEIAHIMRVQGDAGLARVVSDLARELRWDVEDDLARVVGDVAALRLLGGLRSVVGGARESGRRLAGNVAEYLTEESRMLLPRPAYVEWQARLHEAQARLADLERRVAGYERGQGGQARA